MVHLFLGDNVEDPPHMDGRNGFSEFSTLCAKLNIPMIRLSEEDGCLKQMDTRVRDRAGSTSRLSCKTSCKHILVIRFVDGNHSDQFPVWRRIEYNGKRYRLVGIYMGQRKCGHQIGLPRRPSRGYDWSITDADLHKDGIGHNTSALTVRMKGTNGGAMETPRPGHEIRRQ